MTDTTSCPNCSGEYKDIGKHWYGSMCEYPELNTFQKRLVRGILMGDGSVTVTPPDTTGTFSVTVCERNFLEWVDEKLGCFSCGVYDMSSRDEDWRDTYKVKSRRIPYFSMIRDEWYTDDGKSFPDELSLDRLVLSMWYVTDGGISVDDRWDSYRSYISCYNERNKKEKILSYFDDTPFDPYWSGDKQIYIPAGQTDDFLKWIYGPVPGYKYKWNP